MGFLKQLFCFVVDSVPESGDISNNTVSPACQFESNNSDCSLIQKLKDKQAQKKEIDSNIKAYGNNDPAVISTFVELLLKLEANGVEMGVDYRSYHMPGVYNSRLKDSLFRYNDETCFRRVISEMTDESIDAIYTELKAIKNWTITYEDMVNRSKILGEEIQQIKDQLGIE